MSKDEAQTQQAEPGAEPTQPVAQTNPQTENQEAQLVERIEQELEQNPALIERLVQMPALKGFMVAESHRGPLPPARTLAGYEKVLPGAAERVFVMAEGEQAHRHAMQIKQQDRELAAHDMLVAGYLKQDTLGKIFGFVIALCVLGLACLMAVLGHETMALAMVTVDVVGLAAVFAIGKYFAQNESPQEPPQL